MASRQSVSNEKREKVLKRDGYQCSTCERYGGKRGSLDLEIHRVNPVETEGTNEMTDLTTRCVECHNYIMNDTPAPTAEEDVDNQEAISPVTDESPNAGLVGAFIGAWVLIIFLAGSVLFAVQLYVPDFNPVLWSSLGISVGGFIFYTFIITAVLMGIGYVLNDG